jgi:predicted adenine nucleotide alpha hydrolase (AANH) superfamily ATPase
MKNGDKVENFQLMTEKEIDLILKKGYTPTLLLHSCCAPCSTYVLEYLSQYFKITVYYYNPNIYPPEEFYKRTDEQERLIKNMKFKNPVSFVSCDYDSEMFYSSVKGLESIPEGGKRCEECFKLRLRKTAEFAYLNNFDYFTTTLSISPLKNSMILNDIGKSLSEEFNIKYLYSDFKKKNGYKRSCELSKEYDLYRQNYCGCVFSKKEAEERNK